MAKAFGLGAANAWAGQGFYYTAPTTGDVTIEFDLTYYSIEFGYGALGTAIYSTHTVLWIADTYYEDTLGFGVSTETIPANLRDLIINATNFAQIVVQMRTLMNQSPKRYTMRRQIRLSAGQTVRILCGMVAKVSAAGGMTSAVRTIGEVTRIRVIGAPPPPPPSSTLIDVPGLGGIRKTSSPTTLNVYAVPGDTVEWSLWHGASYQQGDRPSDNCAIPHWKSFIVSIARPYKNKCAWLFGRENDNQLAYLTRTGTTTAPTLVDVPGLGGIRRGPSANLLTLYSSSQHVECELWYGGAYQRAEVVPNGTVDVPIPHYQSFILTIARPLINKTAWLFGRENDNQLAYFTLTGTTTAQTLVDVPGLGGIRKGPSANVLTIYSSGQVVEWALWYGTTYQQGEVPLSQTRNVTIPHYKSFILTIARPIIGKTAWLFGRENDGQLAYAVLK